MAHSNEPEQITEIALWPRTLSDLTSAELCPACQRVLRSTVCGFCGLDLSHPASVELMSMSLRAADALDRRLVIIRGIRADTLAARALASPVSEMKAAFVDPADDPSPVAMARPAGASEQSEIRPHQVSPVPMASPMQAEASWQSEPVVATPASHPRRSGVSSIQVALLIAGVSLLSAGAVAFLVYAFLNYGIVWRSVIIGTVTVAAFAAATVLLKRRLRATAEGIAIFAIVLVYLDAWAVRTNDFFGAGGSDPALFWAITVLASCVAFVAWSRSTLIVAPARDDGTTTGAPGVTWLRAPHLVGWGMLPVGAVLLADSLTPDGVSGTPFFALAAVIAVGLLHPLVPIRRPDVPEQAGTIERTVLLAAAAAAMLPALIAAFAVGQTTGVEPDDQGGFVVGPPLVAIAATVGLALLHMLMASRSPSTPARTAWSVVFAAIPGPAILAATSATLLAEADVIPTLATVAVIAAALALLIERGSASPLSPVTLSGSISSWLVGGLAVLAPAVVALDRVGAALAAASQRALRGAPTDVLAESTTDSLWSVGALALIVALAAVVWSSRGAGLSPRRRALILWSAAAVAVVAVPLLSTSVGIVTGWLGLALVALAVLMRTNRSRTVQDGPIAPHMAVCAVLGIVALGLGWLAAWTGTSTWLFATIASIVMLMAARRATSSTVIRAALLSAAAAVLVVGAATLPMVVAIIRPDAALAGVPGDAMRLVTVIGALLVGVAAVAPSRVRFSPLDRRTLFWIGLGTSSFAWATLQAGIMAISVSDTRDLRGITLASAALLLSTLLLWLISRRTSEFRTERMAASIALAPAVYLLVHALAAASGLAGGAGSLVTEPVVAVTAALVTGVGSIVEIVVRPQSRMRLLREVGIGVVAVPALIVSVSTGGADVWLVLLLAAVTVLTVAISRDGLVGSASTRKHLGWLALGLGTASLWVRLGESRVGDIEAFVLPLAGALLLVAVAAHRRRPDGDDSASPAAAGITLVALLVAVLPVSVASLSGEPTRALVVAGISAALMLAGAFGGVDRAGTGMGAEVSGTNRAITNFTAMTLAGALGVLMTGIGRAASLGALGNPGLEFDGWLAFVLVIFIVAGWAIAAHSVSESASDAAPLGYSPRAPRMLASQALALVAIASAALLEAGSILGDAASPLRAELSILALCLIHVLAWFIAVPPFTRLVSWVAIGLAGFVAAVGITVGATDPIEFATVPLALSLLATGSVRMLGDSTARSWPWLGAGTAILLVPSLIATIGDRPIWRLVGLGVVGVAVLISGLIGRLQAPFVIAALVVTIHALATFSPQIRAVYESVEWWIWLIPGGIIVIVLAARLEKRLADLREVVRSIGALR